MLYLNPHQPKRDPNKYFFRTHRKLYKFNFFKCMSRPSLLCAHALYRWTNDPNEYLNYVVVRDLHEYIQDLNRIKVPKRDMGTVIVNAVSYEAEGSIRMDKHRRTYVFYQALDLHFGLEWMLSLAVMKRLEIESQPQELSHTPQHLEDMKHMSSQEFDAIYQEVYGHEPKWGRYNLTDQTRYPSRDWQKEGLWNA